MIHISQKDAQELGLQSSIQASKELGFTDFEKTRAIVLQDAYLDLENLGALKRANPRLVIRKSVDFSNTNSQNSQVWESWRQTVEDLHYYAKYQVTTSLVGQLSEVHIPLSYYNYTDNNFFKPYRETKVVKRLKEFNDFAYARFRFPKNSSNTIDITVNTVSGTQELRPKFPGLISKEEGRKTYYRWHPQSTRMSSGEAVQKYVYKPSPGGGVNFPGFSIPYPNTLSIYEGRVFNIPTKIATKFNDDNSQSLRGLIVISTGDAEQKTICYVSPHTIKSGYLNTVEDIYTESTRRIKSLSAGSHLLATVENASWYGSTEEGYLGCYSSGYIDNLNGTYRECSIPSDNNTHKRFAKIGEETRQIYFDSTLPTQYGSGRWCIALSGNTDTNINTGHNAVVYIHEPNSLTDWQKTDPRTLSGPWVVASGHPKAASSLFLNRANSKKPSISSYKSCRKTAQVDSVRLQVPSLIIDSKFVDSGHVLPKGIKSATYVYTGAIYPSWQTNNETGIVDSGYIINDHAVSMTDILASGIQIPQTVNYGFKYSIDNDGHFKQDIPLRDTYFYKFYNQLYSDNNKSIATGTWDGIIPSGVKVSVELISTTLNEEVGILNDNNIAIIYSGYGNDDVIDRAFQTGISKYGAHIIYPNPSAKYMVSGEVPWTQNRYPYRHAFNDFGQLAYTAFKSGPSKTDALNIARATAIWQINSKILQLVNKIMPSATYKNKKWRRMQAFKSKLASMDSNFSALVVPASATPGNPVAKRLRPYSTGQS